MSLNYLTSVVFVSIAIITSVVGRTFACGVNVAPAYGHYCAGKAFPSDIAFPVTYYSPTLWCVADKNFLYMRDATFGGYTISVLATVSINEVSRHSDCDLSIWLVPFRKNGSLYEQEFWAPVAKITIVPELLRSNQMPILLDLSYPLFASDFEPGHFLDGASESSSVLLAFQLNDIENRNDCAQVTVTLSELTFQKN